MNLMSHFNSFLLGVAVIVLFDASLVNGDDLTSSSWEYIFGYAFEGGTIPTEIGNHTSLTGIDLSHVSLTQWPLAGPIPKQRYLSGTIPTEIFRLTSLTSLHLGNLKVERSPEPSLNWDSRWGRGDESNLNQLGGSIPRLIEDLTNLQELDLTRNRLTGSIPTEIGALTSLTSLKIGENLLTGTIPTEIGALTSLVVLDLGRNILTGTLPTELGMLSNIEEIFLNNKAYTFVQHDESSFTKVVTFVGDNQFTGTIPNEFGQLTKLSGRDDLVYKTGDVIHKLDFQEQSLTGPIPESIAFMHCEFHCDWEEFDKPIPEDFEKCYAVQSKNYKASAVLILMLIISVTFAIPTIIGFYHLGVAGIPFGLELAVLCADLVSDVYYMFDQNFFARWVFYFYIASLIVPLPLGFMYWLVTDVPWRGILRFHKDRICRLPEPFESMGIDFIVWPFWALSQLVRSLLLLCTWLVFAIFVFLSKTIAIRSMRAWLLRFAGAPLESQTFGKGDDNFDLAALNKIKLIEMFFEVLPQLFIQVWNTYTTGNWTLGAFVSIALSGYAEIKWLSELVSTVFVEKKSLYEVPAGVNIVCRRRASKIKPTAQTEVKEAVS